MDGKRRKPASAKQEAVRQRFKQAIAYANSERANGSKKKHSQLVAEWFRNN